MDQIGFKFVFISFALSILLVSCANCAVFAERNEALKTLNSLKSSQHGFNFGSSERNLEILRNAIIPQQMQEFIKIYEANSESQGFIDDLYDVVESPDCRGHLREWFKRASNLSTLFSEENQWVLKSKLVEL